MVICQNNTNLTSADSVYRTISEQIRLSFYPIAPKNHSLLWHGCLDWCLYYIHTMVSYETVLSESIAADCSSNNYNMNICNYTYNQM